MQEIEIKEILGVQTKNIFYCGAKSSADKLFIVVKDKPSAKQIAPLLKKYAKASSRLANCKIKISSSLQLEKVKSLESILDRIPHGQIIIDPTGTLERSKILVALAKKVRLQFPQVTACFFNSEKRNLFFTLKHDVTYEEGTEITKQLENILITYLQSLTKRFALTITVAPRKPYGKVIAIDNQSIICSKKNWVKNLMKKMKWSLFIASASSTLGLTPAKANSHCVQLPAVSKFNGWLGAVGGGVHNHFVGGAGGAGEGGFAFSLLNNLAIQAHGFDGGFAHTNIWSIDGYIFWRDPLQGMVGPHLTYTDTPGLYQTLLGLHGERYLNSLTLVGEFGARHFNTDDENSYYAEALLHWYTINNWDLNLGFINIDGNVAGQIGTEYEVGLQSLPGLSVFADFGVGSHNLVYGLLGIRYYFGDACKSLMCRHREDNIPPTLDLVMLGKGHAKVPAFVS